MNFIAPPHVFSYFFPFTKWHRKANVIFQQLCMETDWAKYIAKDHRNTNSLKTSSETSKKSLGFPRGRSLWSHHKIFHCMSWQHAGGSRSCGSESDSCMMRQTNIQKNEHCVCPQRAECNNASLYYFFTLVKLLEVGIWLCSIAQPPLALTHISKIFRDRALNNFAASAPSLSHHAWSQNF